MLLNILSIIILLVLTFLPILLWGYLFAYIDNSEFNRKRFLSGIFWWVLSVLPILYMDKIFDFLSLKLWNIFYFTSQIGDLLSVFELWFSLSLFLIVVLFIILLFYLKRISKLIKIYIVNIVFFILLWFVISLFFYLINLLSLYFWSLNSTLDNWVNLWEVVFNSLKLIIFYYIIVWFIEETTKHFNFLWTSFLHISSVRLGVLYAIFIALWFSFIENILYLYSSYIKSWLSFDLVKIYFLRSIFSVVVHVLCSSIVAYYFTKALLVYRKKKEKFPFIKVWIVGLIIWICLHAIFDITLTLGFTFIIFIYWILWYFYITSIFYRD